MLSAIRLALLTEMLTYCRPHGSKADNEFRAIYLHPIPGIEEDRYGNLHVVIPFEDGAESPVLWSSHTDTVHTHSGRQRVKVTPRDTSIALAARSLTRSSCLGADDTVGVFLMVEMIKAHTPGHYVFHYGEEAGCIGSGDLANHAPFLLEGRTIAIALDRAGTGDIVTSQHGRTCASDRFAASLSRQLGATWKPAHGVYTDTAEYMDLIPECTNLSVGYYRQHTPHEWVDYAHVGRLLDKLCTLDHTALIVARNPVEEERERREAFARMFADKFRTSPPVTTAETSYQWCVACDARYFEEEDARQWRYLGEVCRCTYPILEEGEEDSDAGLSDDDRKFLAYLRSR